MTNYELLFILPGTLGEDEVKPLIAKVKSVIEASGGTDLTVKELDKKRLAYPMKHIRYGYFQLAYFQAESEAVKTMKKQLSLIPELLRVLVKKYDAKSTAEKKINFGVPIGEEVRKPMPAREPVKEVEAKTEEKVEVQPISREEAEGITVVKDEEVKDKSAKEDKPKKKVKLDEIDKKLDEILDIDLTNV